jgi:Tol biopolymer transport system component
MHRSALISRAAIAMCLAAACTGSPEPPTLPSVISSLELTVASTGRDLDLDGYTVTVDGGSPIAVPINGVTTIPSLEAGEHTVAIAGIQPNCVSEPASIRVNVPEGAPGTARFDVTCSRFWALAFDHPAGIQVTDLAGTARTLLLPDAAGAAWSPDGRSLAASVGPDAFVVSVINEDGTGRRELDDTRDRGEYGAFDPVWAPDGESLLYNSVAVGTSLHTTLYRNLLDGRVEAIETTRNPSCPMGWSGGSAASWSPDSRRIAVSSYEIPGDQPRVDVLDADDANRRFLAPNGHDPEWSPDGSTVAFLRGTLPCRDERFSETAIHLVSSDGNNDRRLTTPDDDQTDIRPAWSPDGSMIAFVRYGVGETGVTSAAIYVINADGTGERKVAESSSLSFTTVGWSPDGRYLAFTDRAVHVVAVDGSDLRAVGDEGTCCAAWRP